MRKWENKCPNCGSENIKECPIDVYYHTNPSVFYCQEEGCGTEVTVEMVPYIKSTVQRV
jgi:hypothetical protein